ncbi:MAG: hypothetical protein LEGION0398_MBIBDBAK_01220 [Legionellaceae bacterium]
MSFERTLLIQIPWWNIKTQQIQWLKLPEHKIKVLPLPQDKTIQKTNDFIREKPTLTINALNKNYKWPWIITGLTSMAWVITLLLWYLKRKPFKFCFNPNKKWQTQIKAACEENNPEATKIILLKWAQKNWPEYSFHTLSDIIPVIQCENFHKQLKELDRILYGEKKAHWNGKTFWIIFKKWHKNHKKKYKKNKNKSLPPLYPE